MFAAKRLPRQPAIATLHRVPDGKATRPSPVGSLSMCVATCAAPPGAEIPQHLSIRPPARAGSAPATSGEMARSGRPASC